MDFKVGEFVKVIKPHLTYEEYKNMVGRIIEIKKV